MGIEAEINFQELEDLTFLNKGNFGSVSKGSFFGQDVAVKLLFQEEDSSMEKYIEREIEVIRTMRHPNIVQFFGISKHENNIYIVTEFVNGGDLHMKLHDPSIQISWHSRVKIALETCQGVRFLHSRGVVHRDLKSANLLLDKETLKVKICDFGFARAADRKELMTICGTDEWMAPEVCLGEKYDERADVFSFGMIVVELITRQDPEERTVRSMFDFEPEPFLLKVPDDCPPDFVKIALECTAGDPEARPNLKDVVTRLKAILATLPKSVGHDKSLADLTVFHPKEETEQEKKHKHHRHHRTHSNSSDKERKDKVSHSKRNSHHEVDKLVTHHHDKDAELKLQFSKKSPDRTKNHDGLAKSAKTAKSPREGKSKSPRDISKSAKSPRDREAKLKSPRAAKLVKTPPAAHSPIETHNEAKSPRETADVHAMLLKHFPSAVLDTPK